jgi:hypothetical protein
MSADSMVLGRRFSAIAPVAGQSAEVSCESIFFDSSANPGFLEGFQCGRLRVGEAGLGAAFGEGPAPGATSFYQQEFYCAPAQAVADGSHLLTFADLAKPGQGR